MRLFIKAPFYFILVLVFVSSCKKGKVDKEIIDTDCGCNGSTYLAIENIQARHIGNGRFVINKTDTNGSLTQAWACNADTTWVVNTDEKIWNYIISGNLKKQCRSTNEEYVIMAPGGPIQITAIKKNI